MNKKPPICPNCKKNACNWSVTYKDWALCFDCSEKIEKANKRGDFDLNKTRYRKESGIPKRYNTADLRDFTPQIRELVSLEKGLHIYGKVGTGKTHLACAIANEFISNNKKVFFFNFPTMLEEMRREYRENTERKLLSTALYSENLILDDIGVERDKEFAVEQLYLIINYRYNNKLYTTLTTNKEDEELETRIARRSLEVNTRLELF